MKRKIGILAFILFPLCLSGCSLFSGGGGGDHFYQTTWTYNEEYHWHRCLTAGHSDEYKDKEAHVFERIVHEPGFDYEGYTTVRCTICGYNYDTDFVPMLEHHYSEEYSYNNTYHWRTCIDEGFEYSTTEEEPHEFKRIVQEATDYRMGYVKEVCDCGYVKSITYSTPITYTVTWKNYDGNKLYVDMLANKGIVPTYYGDTPYKSIDGDPKTYKFVGWDRNITPVDGDTTYTARFEVVRNKYNVTYIGKDDNVVYETATDSFDDAFKYYNYNLPSYMQNGAEYQFTGWEKASDDGNGLITYRAVFVPSAPDLRFGEDCVSYYSGEAEELNIPSNWAGREIKRIASSAFKNNASITKISLPVGIEEIGDYAFSGCTRLSTINIPSTVKKIGKCAFEGCTLLKSINIPEGVKELGNKTFYNCKVLRDITIADGLETIGENVFTNCISLKSIKIPSTVTSIAASTFNGCTGLELMEIPFVGTTEEDTLPLGSIFGRSSTGNISQGSNYYCVPEKLETIIVDRGTIPNYGFANMTALKTVLINNTIDYIGTGAFNNTALTSLVLPTGIKQIYTQNYKVFDSVEFYEEDGCLYISTSENRYEYFFGVKDDTVTVCNINDNCRLIRQGALEDSKVETLYVPFLGESVGSSKGLSYIASSSGSHFQTVTVGEKQGEVIPYGAFSSYKTLKKIVLPEKITEIGNRAFENCSNLSDLEIPSTLKTLGDGAFEGCSALGTTAGNAKYIGNSENPYLILVSSNVTSYDGDVIVREGCKFISSTIYKSGDTYARNLSISSTVSSISLSGLKKSSKLSSLYISEDNNYFSVKNYFLYSKDFKTLLWVSRNNSSIPSAVFEGIETIGGYALYACGKLTKVTIPNNVKQIEDGALASCSSLEELSVPFLGSDADDGDLYSIFKNQNTSINLKKLTINEGVSSLKISISGSTYFKSLSLPSTLKSIEVEKFAYRTLESVELNGNLRFEVSNDMLIDKNNNKVLFALDTIEGNVTIPDGIKTIGKSAFESCTFITNVSFPDSLETIEDKAFYNCSKLTSLLLPESVNTLGKGAIGKCAKITKVAIPFTEDEENISLSYYTDGNKLPSLKDLTFTKNIKSLDASYLSGFESNLETLTLPSSIETIDVSIFENCNYLKNIGVDDSNTNFSSYYGILYNKEKTELLYCPKAKDGGISIPETITEITKGELKNRKNITSIVLENPETYIADEELSGCTSLELTEYEGGLYLGTARKPYIYLVKVSDKTLESYTIHEDCQYILDSAFSDCIGVEKITIPSKVVHIGKKAFTGCISLKEVNLSNAENLIDIGNEAFRECTSIKTITIPDNIKQLGYGVFLGCTSLNSLTLPFAGRSLEEGKVYDLFTNEYGNQANVPTLLKTIKITAPCAILNDSAFYNMSNVENITLPGGLQSIGKSAFKGCSSLKELDVGDRVKYIGKSAFSGCTSLESLTVPFIGETKDENTYIGYWFDADYETYKNRGVPASLKTVILSELCTYVPEHAFDSCANLENVILSENITRIEDYAFAYCSNLKDIRFNSKIEYIGVGAFYYCHSFVTIDVPNSVTYIGKGAFAGNNSATTIKIPFIGTTVDDDEHNIEYIYEYINIFDHAPKRTYILSNKVKVIPADAFTYNSRTAKVVIPDSVESISPRAFRAIYDLETTEYKSVKYIGNDINPYLCAIATTDEINDFEIHKDCKFILIEYSIGTMIGTITIPSNVCYICPSFLENDFMNINVSPTNDYFSSDDGVLYNKDKTSLIKCPNGRTASYSTLSSTTRLEDGAFYGCDGLQSLTLNEGLQYIGFISLGDIYLETLVIPGTVKDIVPGAFRGSGFDSISVKASNGWYVSENNAIYNGNYTTLLYVAFRNNYDFVMRDTVENILDYAMYDYRTDEVIVTKNVKYIGTYALNTGNVQFITFLGFYEEWDNIDKQIDFATEDIFLVSCSDRDATFDYTLYSSWYHLF